MNEDTRSLHPDQPPEANPRPSAPSCRWIAPRLVLAGDTHNALGLFLLGAFQTGA
ncbi:hypothetical protein ACWC2T_15310 [Streptomyces sp. NPDC001393]